MVLPDRWIAVVAAVLTLAALAPAAAAQAPRADYGDAPDDRSAGYPAPFDAVVGRFPTLFDTANGRAGAPGAHALDGSADSLGGAPSLEVDADDPADPDGVPNLIDADSDDAPPGIVVLAASIPARSRLAVDVTADPAVAVPRFLNVLIDLDLDGRWAGRAAGGEPEWVVRNFRLDPFGPARFTATPPDFLLSNGAVLPEGAWMRLALTREPVDAAAFGADGWDGSGAFAFGEIEDFQIAFGRGGGGKFTPVTDICCPPRVPLDPRGAPTRFSCLVFSRNMLVTAPVGQADLFFNPLPGNADVRVTAVPPLPGPAPVPPPVGFVGRSLAPFPPLPSCPPPVVGGPFGRLVTFTARRPDGAPQPFRSLYTALARPVDPPGDDAAGRVVPEVYPAFQEIEFFDVGVGLPDVYPPYDDPLYDPTVQQAPPVPLPAPKTLSPKPLPPGTPAPKELPPKKPPLSPDRGDGEGAGGS